MRTPLLLAAAAGIVVFCVALLRAMRREWNLQKKEVSRAACLVEIVDTLNSAGMNLREKMKRAGRALAIEGDQSGWRCRIVIENNPSLLPPTGPVLGFHVPMTAGDRTVGMLIVNSPGGRLDPIDKKFFDVAARSLGLFVHRERIWEDFYTGGTRRQAALLLRGEVDNSVDNKL